MRLPVITTTGLAFCCCLVVGAASAQGLPPAATPGGALPDLDERITEPFVYPDTVLPQEPSAPLVVDDPDAPRMQVRGFRLLGIVERAEIGITREIIEKLLRTEAQKLVAGDPSRGFTLNMFEQLTRAISRYYRDRGFFLARAYIPEQQVDDGIVAIKIIEGFLDQVVFRNNKLYSDAQLQELFAHLVGESVFLEDIENVIFIADDLPGLDVSALFGPGLKPGSAAIQFTVDEKPSSGYLSWDNHGSFYTGEQRLRGNYALNNLLGKGDRIEGNLLLMIDPQNATYFDLSYEQPVLSHDFLAGGGYSWNSFDVGGNLADLKINGDTSIINGYITYFYRRKRSERMTATLDLSLKEAESRVVSTTESIDKLTVISVQGLYEGTSWSDMGAYQQIAVKLSIGLGNFLGSMEGSGDENSGRIGGSGDFGGGDFTKLNFDYLRIQPLSELTSLTFKASLQESSDLLTSPEQLSLGGPDTVRAYPVAESLVDTAWLLSIEWRARASPTTQLDFLNGLQYLVFLDYAKGSLNDPLNNEIDEVALSGFGFGVELLPYKTMKASVIFGFDLGDEPSENQSLPFYFNLQYDF